MNHLFDDREAGAVMGGIDRAATEECLDAASAQVEGVRLMQPATVRTKSWEVSGFTR